MVETTKQIFKVSFMSFEESQANVSPNTKPQTKRPNGKRGKSRTNTLLTPARAQPALLRVCLLYSFSEMVAALSCVKLSSLPPPPPPCPPPSVCLLSPSLCLSPPLPRSRSSRHHSPRLTSPAPRPPGPHAITTGAFRP